MRAAIVPLVATRLRDPLRRNADALILGTGVTSGLGFAFWALAARWLPAAAVGIGAALMSSLTLLANLATLGLRNGLVRFLPRAGAATVRLIFVSYAVCTGAAVLAAGIFLLGQPLWAAQLDFLRHGPLAVAAFMASTVVWVIYILQDHVLVGLRRTLWVPVQNAFASVLKIIALPLFASLTVWSVLAATVVTAVPAVAGVTWLVLHYGRAAAAADRRPAREARIPLSHIVRFAASDHVAALLWLCTTDVLTLIVLHEAGAAASAYFYLANTIGYTLYLVTSNVGSALIAESAHDLDNSTTYARRALWHSAQLVVPLAVIGIALAPFVLRILGPGYAEHATHALQLILLSAVPQLIVGISVSTARVFRDMRTVVATYAFMAVTTWGGSWLGLQLWGITGVGLACLLSQTLAAALLLATGRTGLWPSQHGWRALLGDAEGVPLALRRRRRRRHVKRLLLPALDACGLAGAQTPRMLTSDSDCLVVGVTHSAQPKILKIAISTAASAGLDRHTEALARLRPRLGSELAAMLPEVTCSSLLRGNRILVESALPGAAAAPDAAGRLVSSAALVAVTRLHEATRRLRPIDDALLGRWVDQPLHNLRASGMQSGAEHGLDRVGELLRDAWLGEQVHTAFVHGDYWTGNVLVAQDAPTPSVTGIVDWENAWDEGLPDVDLVHWWLTIQRAQLGTVVCQVLEEPSLISTSLTEVGVTLPNPHLEMEHVVLLTWLWHASAAITRASATKLGLVWWTRNVRPVLRLVSQADSASGTRRRR